MATALSSTRTGASRASAALLNSSAAKTSSYAGASRRSTQLAEEMHRRLYPQYYNENGRPKPSVRKGNKKFQKIKAPRRDVFVRWKGNQKTISKVAGPGPAIKKTCPDPISAVTASQIALLDPTGARTRLFSRTNPECARVGDILLVRQRTGDPFSGVCINIRRRGVDTAILLRGQLTRVGIEMWYKIYSPLVEGIEVVQRAAKRARRARLTYMRKVKHDRGSVENVVRVYLRQKAALGTAEGMKKKGAKAAAAMMMGGKKKGGKKGKKR